MTAYYKGFTKRYVKDSLTESNADTVFVSAHPEHTNRERVCITTQSPNGAMRITLSREDAKLLIKELEAAINGVTRIDLNF